MSQLLRTPLYDWHCSQNARMTQVGGWIVPELYTSVAHEHEAARNGIGVMDISHNGHFVFEGPGACQFLDSLLSRNITALKPGQIRFSLLTNENGGIIDDLLVGRFLREGANIPNYHLFVNAVNREKDVAYFKRFLMLEDAKTMGRSVFFSDETMERGVIAVRGPRSLELLQPLFQADISQLKYCTGVETSLQSGRPVMVSRTGYTGRDGFEVTLESFFMEQFVELLFQRGKPFGIVPIGLATRDTLRLEEGISRYGNELDEDITPFEAGIPYALYWDGLDFPGKKILYERRERVPERIRVGLEISGSQTAGKDDAIFLENRKIGRITSGAFSPLLQKSIAMGYIPSAFSQTDQPLTVEIGGERFNAMIVPMPFYKRGTTENY